jgi:hypothetical protein
METVTKGAQCYGSLVVLYRVSGTVTAAPPENAGFLGAEAVDAMPSLTYTN